MLWELRLGRLMLGLSVAAADGGFLGLSADQYGLYHTPSPALDSLHADYHFFHHHEMAAGTQLALDGVSSFGSSAHVRVQPLLKTGAADGALSLSLCKTTRPDSSKLSPKQRPEGIILKTVMRFSTFLK